MNVCMTASAIFLCCGTLAQAQIAVPPSAPVAPTKEYVPPPEVKPFDTKSVNATPTPPPAPAAVVLPDLPYESLAKKDANGNLPALSEPVEWAALRVNPTITEQADKDRVKQIIADRLRQYQTIVIENIDFMHQIDAGLLEKIDVTSANAKADMIKVKLLAGKGTLVKALKESHALNEVQIKFNQKIADERVKAEYASPTKSDNPEQARKDTAGSVGSSVLRQAVAEAMHARRALFITAAGKIGDLGAKFGMGSDHIKAISSATTDDAKFAAVLAGVKEMPVEKQREFLTAALR